MVHAANNASDALRDIADDLAVMQLAINELGRRDCSVPGEVEDDHASEVGALARIESHILAVRRQLDVAVEASRGDFDAVVEQ